MTSPSSSLLDFNAWGPVVVPETAGMVDGLGRAIENFACEYAGYDYDEQTHHDASTRCGRPVQIKGAAWRVQNGRQQSGGQAYAHGRFRLYERDHEWLLDNDGVYCFVVYEQHDLGLLPLYAREVSAGCLDSYVLEDDGWWDSQASVPKADGGDVRVAWPRVFPEGVTL